jgi:hypothetical protein
MFQISRDAKHPNLQILLMTVTALMPTVAVHFANQGLAIAIHKSLKK